MHAFKDGITMLNAANMNELLSLQNFTMISEGEIMDDNSGAGIAENSLANYTYMAKFCTSPSGYGRIELELDKDGVGSDLTVEIRGNDFNPNGSNDGTLVCSLVIPKEFIALTKSYISVPIPDELEFLTDYWVRVNKAGDAINKINWIGESSQDTAHPAYRRFDSSGYWAPNNDLHFKYYSGYSGMPKHVIYAENQLITIDWVLGLPTKIYTYLPPSDGSAGGIRETLTITWRNGMPVIGEVS